MEIVANKVKEVIQAQSFTDWKIYATLEDEITELPCVLVNIEGVENTDDLPCHYDGQLFVSVLYHGKDNQAATAKALSVSIKNYLLSDDIIDDLYNAGLVTIAITDEGAGMALENKANQINRLYNIFYHSDGD
jgi:hypothetical protein